MRAALPLLSVLAVVVAPWGAGLRAAPAGAALEAGPPAGVWPRTLGPRVWTRQLGAAKLVAHDWDGTAWQAGPAVEVSLGSAPVTAFSATSDTGLWAWSDDATASNAAVLIGPDDAFVPVPLPTGSAPVVAAAAAWGFVAAGSALDWAVHVGLDGAVEALPLPEAGAQSAVASAAVAVVTGPPTVVYYVRIVDLAAEVVAVSNGELGTPVPLGAADAAQACATPSGKVYVAATTVDQVLTSWWDGAQWLGPYTGVDAHPGGVLACEEDGALWVETDADTGRLAVDVLPTGERRAVFATGLGAPVVAGVSGSILDIAAATSTGGTQWFRDSTAQSAPPFIALLDPTPAVAGQVLVVEGGHLDPATLGVLVDSAPAPTQQAQPYRVEVLLPDDLEAGSHVLSVQTAAGADFAPFDSVPAPPVIDTVEPSPLMAGELAVVYGKHLDTTTSVHLGDVPQEVQTTSFGAVTFRVASSTPPGPTQLVLATPAASATRNVVVGVPPPRIDVVTPNPVQAGRTVTIRGAFFADVELVSAGSTSWPVLSAASDEIVAFVRTSTPPGPHQVTVTAAGGPSDPAGPVWVDPPPPGLPAPADVLPRPVGAGLDCIVTGERMDRAVAAKIAGAEAPIEVESEHWLRVTIPADTPPGGALLWLVGPSGAMVTTSIDVSDAGGAEGPHIDAVDPPEAAWGERVTLHGSGLASVHTVLVGATVEPIEEATPDRLTFTLDPETPGGAQVVLALGAGASNVASIAIHFAAPGGADAASADVGTADALAVGAGSTPSHDAGQGDGAAGAAPGDGHAAGPAEDAGTPSSDSQGGGGCAAGAGVPSPGAVVVVWACAWMAVARRRLRRCHPCD